MSDRFSRRAFIKSGIMSAGSLAAATLPLGAFAQSRPMVYFTHEISSESLKKIYALVNQGISGKVAVKLHTGEPNGPYLLPRDMVKKLLEDIPNSNIVECNVLYSSPRQTTEGHRNTIATNGWDFCPVDIMDEEGDVNLPIPNGQWLQEVAVGSHLSLYDSMLVLTHFKGHAMGGFGGALKNISIGCASGSLGKAQIHRDGRNPWGSGPLFMERMAEAGKAITSFFGPRITYINVLRCMSVDCDCFGTRAVPPKAPDIGILASTDILAIDQASIDLVYALPEIERHDLVARIESRSGLRQLEYMKIIGMGSDQYHLIVV